MDQSVARLNLRVQRIMKEAKERSENRARKPGPIAQPLRPLSKNEKVVVFGD